MKHISVAIAAAIMVASCGKNENDFDASGVFEATEVVVSARGTGVIEQLDVTEGQEVTPGTALGYIDTLQLSLQRRQLMASLSASESHRLDENRQLASLRQQLENALSEQRRYQQLVEDNAAPRRQLDEINYQIEVLRKQISAVTEQIGSANSSVAGQSSGIAAQVARIDAQIDDCIISSPTVGTVLSKYAEAGEYAVPGKPLFKVGDISHIRLRAYITASQLSELQLGDTVRVYSDEGEQGRRQHSGVVSWISDQAEFTPKTIRTRDERSNLVYAVKIDVDNDGSIKRGMYGDVKFGR